eukprot:scaffold1629_cov369-Prasinococcus_capsulatus_cf.AAC.28
MQLGMLADVSDAWEKLSLQQKRTLNVIGFGIGALALSSLMAGRTDDNCDQKPTDTNMGIPVSKARIPQHTQALRFCGTSTPTHILTEFLLRRLQAGSHGRTERWRGITRRTRLWQHPIQR